MFNHYYTLKWIAAKLHEEFSGSVIQEIFTQEKNEIIFVWKNSSSASTIHFSCDGRFFHLLKRDSFHRAKKNSIDLFPAAVGKTIESIGILPNERCINIALAGGTYFSFLLIPAKSNVYLFGADHIQVAQFKQLASPPHLRSDIETECISLESLLKDASDNPEQTLDEFLKNRISLLGSTLLQELVIRSNLPPSILISELGTKEMERIITAYFGMIEELEHPAARIYERNGIPERFSLIPLHSCSDLREQKYDDLFKALNSFLRASFSRRRFLDLQKRISQALTSEKKHLEISLSKIESIPTLMERSLLYEKYGALLMTVIYESPTQPDRFSVQDIFSEHHQCVDIPLQTSLSVLENAQRYFEKSKQCKSAIQLSGDHRLRTARKLAQVRDALFQSDACLDYSSLMHYISSNKKMLRTIGINEHGEKESKPFPFRRFKVAGGFEVWAGKNNVNNDELTLHGTDKDDLWFHARDIGGSHVVLKVHSSSGDVSKEAIVQTASIAAYYSKHRKAKSVAVAYTQKKYVRKPKGVPAGTVFIEREKVILVPPALPPQQENSQSDF